MTLFDLSGHVGLVTGGNSGIGLGYAEGLAECGAAIAVWGTNPAKNDAAVERLSQYGVDVHAVDRPALAEPPHQPAGADQLALRYSVTSASVNARLVSRTD